MYEDIEDKAFEYLQNHRKISIVFLMRKYQINGAFARQIYHRILLRNHLEARKLAKKVEYMEDTPKVDSPKKQRKPVKWSLSIIRIPVSFIIKLKRLNLKDMSINDWILKAIKEKLESSEKEMNLEKEFENYMKEMSTLWKSSLKNGYHKK